MVLKIIRIIFLYLIEDKGLLTKQAEATVATDWKKKFDSRAILHYKRKRNWTSKQKH